MTRCTVSTPRPDQTRIALMNSILTVSAEAGTTKALSIPISVDAATKSALAAGLVTTDVDRMPSGYTIIVSCAAYSGNGTCDNVIVARTTCDESTILDGKLNFK